MKNIYSIIIIIFSYLNPVNILAQSMNSDNILTLQEAFTLAIQHSTQLKISGKNIALAKQQTEIQKLSKLPSIYSGLIYGYISNADIWTPSFSNHQKGNIPHQSTQLSVTATETIFNGGKINNLILKSSLEEQVAILSFEKNTVDINFFLAGSFCILEYHRFFNEKLNDNLIVFGIAAVYKNIRGILTCRCSNSCLLVPPVIIKKLNEMNMNIQWSPSALIENNN